MIFFTDEAVVSGIDLSDFGEVVFGGAKVSFLGSGHSESSSGE